MTEIVINFNAEKGEYQIYENTSQTLIISRTLGEGFSNLNKYLLTSGQISKSLIEDPDVRYHFDSYTFKEIIKSNMSLLRRVSEIPSEFKNSASKFGGMPSSQLPQKDSTFQKKESNFQRGRMSGFKGSDFSKSYGKFNKK